MVFTSPGVVLTSRRVEKNYPASREKYVSSIGNVSQETIKKYIDKVKSDCHPADEDAGR